MLSNNLIIEVLEQGLIPWHGHGLPKNILSKKPYTGINSLLLLISARKNNFLSPYWGTSVQWETLGKCPVNQTGTEIVLYKPTFGNIIVYNGDQVGEKNNFSPQYTLAEEVITRTSAKIKHQWGNKAIYYYPPKDLIVFPCKQQFVEGAGGLNGYYYSLFHELMHWTESRTNWSNSLELMELRAEIGASYLSNELNIQCLPFNLNTTHRTYLKKWIKRIKEDLILIDKISEDAMAGVQYLYDLRKLRNPD